MIIGQTSYTFVDALLMLLREGLEAILIIAGLVAFLKKTNHADKQVWIWGGVIQGVIAGAILAVCIHIFFSTITAATSREYLEGVIGIVAVVMMLTVGAWLHKKTDINNWNQYMKENLGKALAKGSLFSMAILSFLSIFREGAETIIFYAGMAPSIEVNQLVLGIAIALFILIILGFVIIRYSKVIPIRPFFVLATVLIYVLSFKMLGVSIHALQIANVVPTHSLQQVPYIEFIGLYPTLETISLGADTTARQTYPSFLLARKINVGNFVQRIEGTIAIMWFITIYFKMALYFYASVLGITQILNLKHYRPLTLPLGMILVVLSIIMFEDIVKQQDFDVKVSIPYSLSVGLFLPLIMLVVSIFRKKVWKKGNEST